MMLPEIRTPRSRVKQGRVITRTIQYPIFKGGSAPESKGPVDWRMAIEDDFTYETFIPGEIEYQGTLDVLARSLHNHLALGIPAEDFEVITSLWQYGLDLETVRNRMQELGL